MTGSITIKVEKNKTYLSSYYLLRVVGGSMMYSPFYWFKRY